ncbi:MAG: hypothetical protein CSA65_07280 [Proteobacteria bacterium]|nr:MAG: hypothetical protein CSB49_02210 [Pseudomonadota bacterium]PIE17817.1 MAG: hypothetical protein CSA65_07280 [Pseudomonadota bacterium]
MLLPTTAMVFLIAGCATSSVRDVQQHASLHTTSLTGSVVLADGKAVPGASVALACGSKTLTAQADAEGRFALQKVPTERCRASVSGTTLDAIVDLRSNLLRASAPLRLVVPTLRRVTLVAKVKDKNETIVVDEAVPGSARFEEQALIVPLRRALVRVDLAKATASVDSPGVTIVSVTIAKRAEMPVFARPAPQGRDVLGLTLRQGFGVTTLGRLLGKRSMVWVGRCRQVTQALQDDLTTLLSSHGNVGLRAAMLTTDRCAAASEKTLVYEAGPAARWALSAKHGELQLLDERGERKWRKTDSKSADAVASAVKHLEANWPLFAAVRKVSVRESASVSAATTQRLMVQAGKLSAKKDYRAAQRLLDEVLSLQPTNAEARKLRALTKAALGDLTGALTEVGWWRDEFGDEAADELMDAVKKTSPQGL